MDNSKETVERKNAHIHYAASFMGGFLAIYPILSIAKIFGSAQTANLIELVLDCVKGHWAVVLLRFIGMLLYGFGVFAATLVITRTKFNVKILSLFVNVATGIVMFFLPDNLPAVCYLYPTFVAMSFQWASFPGAYGFVSSSIFSTNNWRQTVSAATEFFINKKSEFKIKMIFYAVTLLFFHLGIVASYVGNQIFGKITFIGIIIPAIITYLLLKNKDK